MRRILLALAMAFLMAAMTAAYALPGFAQISQEEEEEVECGSLEYPVPADEASGGETVIYDPNEGGANEVPVNACPIEQAQAATAAD